MSPDASRLLAQTAAKLTPRQQQLLQRMADALLVPVHTEIGSSDLVDDAFRETLGNFLLLHHAIHEEPLNKAAFEYVLKACAESSGRTSEQNIHQGSAAWDVKIGTVRWSLKTESARGISPGTVKIEKLMEARWIRECTNPAKCAKAVRAEIPAHMAGYDRILMLRAFRQSGNSVKYELVEPPKKLLLKHIKDARPENFTKEGAKESYGANFSTSSGDRIFRILLDSSVEKIRLSFSHHHCVNHGSWTVRPAAVQDAVVSTTEGKLSE